MKGYAKYRVTQEERDKLKSFLDERDQWIESFSVETKTVGWWIFKTTIEIDQNRSPPSGLYLFDYDRGTGVYERQWLLELRRIYSLIKYNDEVLLDHDFSTLYDKYVRYTT